MRKNEKNEANL